MQIVISGIQPTNKLTLGNYAGAIKDIIKYQDEYKLYAFVADLHALSNPAVDNKDL
jgi:tryptophanyl-tRNA synthetase